MSASLHVPVALVPNVKSDAIPSKNSAHAWVFDSDVNLLSEECRDKSPGSMLY